MQVANFELSDAEVAARAEKEKEKAEKEKEKATAEGKFWDALLKDHYVENQSQELETMGRGRRRKPKVSTHESQ